MTIFATIEATLQDLRAGLWPLLLLPAVALALYAVLRFDSKTTSRREEETLELLKQIIRESEHRNTALIDSGTVIRPKHTKL